LSPRHYGGTGAPNRLALATFLSAEDSRIDEI